VGTGRDAAAPAVPTRDAVAGGERNAGVRGAGVPRAPGFELAPALEPAPAAAPAAEAAARGGLLSAADGGSGVRGAVDGATERGAARTGVPTVELNAGAWADVDLGAAPLERAAVAGVRGSGDLGPAAAEDAVPRGAEAVAAGAGALDGVTGVALGLCIGGGCWQEKIYRRPTVT
jgi:hypothetical protein